MNAQILYATMTGHSRKIANAIAQKTGLPVHDLAAQPRIPDCDLLFIVSGIYGGECKPELLAHAQQIKAKRVVLITSSTRGIAQGGLRATLTRAGLTVDAREYQCKGSFLFAAMGHPNRVELNEAAEFAAKMVKDAQ